MRLVALIALLLFSQALPFRRSGVTGQLMALDSTGRFIINQTTGEPVYVVGEDAFDLAVQVSNSDAVQYLTDRASKGYNLIWVAAADNTYQANPPQDFYGDLPFSGGNFLGMSGQTAYWAHIDYVIQQAATLGIVIGLNPCFIGLNGSSGYLTSFNAASSATITAYGQFLGNRYKSYNNIVWILGGDADPSTGPDTNLAVLATAIKSVDSVHLMTIEMCRVCTPAFQSSLDVWTAPPFWLNINWVYPNLSSVQAQCASNYARSPWLPPLDGEDWYELENSMTVLQLREEAYWSSLSGCYIGRLFGNGAIWPMGGPSNVTGQTWQSQLSSTGSVQWQYAGQLMRSREHWKMVPDATNTVLTGGIGSGSTISVASCTSDGQTCIVYDPIGNSQAPQIAMGHFSGTIHAWWFNPQTGTTTDLSTFTNSGTHIFIPSDGNDWVLVLDLNSSGLCAPGSCAI